jgi:uncharacterized protein
VFSEGGMKMTLQQGFRGWMLTMLLMVSGTTFAQTDAANETRCPTPPPQPSNERVTQLMQSAADRGFMWRIEKNGRVSHLYGTIHINKLEWAFPGKKTVAALGASDVIALELDILDPGVQQAMADPARFGIRKLDIPPGNKRRIEVAANSLCLSGAAIQSMHPMMQMISMTLIDARFIDLDPGFGSEVFLANFARGAKKPVASLETPEIQMRALLGGDEKEMLEHIDQALKQFEARKSRKIMERLAATWASSNLSELESYENWCECVNTPLDRAFLKRVNEDRNAGLARGIDRLHMSGKRVFAAVGSLHMVGPKGLPRLLAGMGYRVERVAFAQQ